VSPSVSDSINIDTGSTVISVNGKIGVVVLDKCDIGLCNVDDTSDLNKPLSYATISALYLKVDMVDFLTLRSLVTSNSANWNSVYSNVLANSSRWEYAYNTVIGGLSSNLWNSVYTNVNSNSANWQGTHSWVRSNSANATFETISALSLSGVFYGDGSNLIGASLPGQASINTLVRSNSASWNSAYASTTALNLSSGNWNSTFTTLCANSATWVKFQPNPDIPTDATAVALTVSNSLYHNGIYIKDSSTNYSLPNSLVDITFNGSIWELIDDGTLYFSSSNGPAYPWLATWTTITVTRNNLEQVVGQPLASTGSTGISKYAARADHVHPFPTAEQIGSPLIHYGSSIVPFCGTNSYNYGANYSSILGGDYNRLSQCDASNYSVIVGGCENTSSGCYSSIGGGANNEICGNCTTIGGGSGNTSCSIGSTVAGGTGNNASYSYSVIGGGKNNTASNACSVIGGGAGNTASGAYSTVPGGSYNTASGFGSVANGMGANTTGGTLVLQSGFNCWYAAPTPVSSGNYSVVGGGFQNIGSGEYSNVAGGFCNTASGAYSNVNGGSFNRASGRFSFVAGGSANDTKGFANTFIFGTSLSATQANYTYVNNLSSQGVVASQGGNSNNWNSAFNNSTVYANNSASYATYNYVNTNFFNLTGGIISGATRINNNLTVFGNLTATGTTTFANTVFSVTSSLSVVHIGSGPALYVGNNGTGDIASFYDIDQNIEVLHVGGNNGSFPNVGVKTSSPNVDFTVNGQISANNTIWSAGGNSNNWNIAYNTSTAYQGISGSFVSFGSNDEALPIIILDTNQNLQYKRFIQTGTNAYGAIYATSGSLQYGDPPVWEFDIIVRPNNPDQLLWRYSRLDAQEDNPPIRTPLYYAVYLSGEAIFSLSGPWYTTTSLNDEVSSSIFQVYFYSPYAGIPATDYIGSAGTSTYASRSDHTHPFPTTQELGAASQTDFNNYRTSVAASTATLLPTTVYRSASGSFATNTLLQSTSALLTPVTTTRTLTSQLVLNTAINSLTGNWNSAYASTTALNLSSSNWNSTFTSWRAASATSVVSFNDTRFSKLSSQAYIINGTHIQPIQGGNTASGYYGYSNIGGGCGNTISGYYGYSYIGGGADNIISDAYGQANYATIGGGSCNNSSAWAATVGGGFGNCAFGSYSTVAGGSINKATNYYDTVAGGINNTASGCFSNVAGGLCNIASGCNSNVAGGRCNTASGYISNVAGGSFNTASGAYSTVIGGRYAAATQFGEISHSTVGYFQHSIFTLSTTTNSTVPKNLALDGNTLYLTLSGNNIVYHFNTNILAVNTTNGLSNFYTIKGIVKNINNTISISPATIKEEMEEDSNMNVDVYIDSVNKYMTFQVIGVSAQNIRWGAVLDTVKITY
jgi:hypothetical protein